MDKPTPTPLGHLIDQVNEAYPEGTLHLMQAAKLIRLVDEDRQRVAAAAAPQSQPEIVRIFRIYVFEGPRAKVEEQVARSITGTKEPGNGVKIHAATIGAFPEILTGGE